MPDAPKPPAAAASEPTAAHAVRSASGWVAALLLSAVGLQGLVIGLLPASAGALLPWRALLLLSLLLCLAGFIVQRRATSALARAVVRRLAAAARAEAAAQERLATRLQQQTKLQAVWAGLPIGVLEHDAAGRVVDANPVAERLLGDTAAALQRRDPADPQWHAGTADGRLLAAEDHPVARTLATGDPVRDLALSVRMADGQRQWLRWTTQVRTDSKGRRLGVFSCLVDPCDNGGDDDTGSGQGHDPARCPDTDTDPASGLPTRAMALDRIARALSHARRHPGFGFAVVCVRVDAESARHADQLRQVASRLQQLLRPGDAVACSAPDGELAAPVGSDALALVLDGVTDGEMLQVIAERLLRDLCEPCAVGSGVGEGERARDGYGLQPPRDTASARAPGALRVSLGMTLCRDPAPSLTAVEVLRQADLALHDAGQAGSGHWRLHDSSIAARMLRQQALHRDLQRAREAGELVLLYQPVIDLQPSRALQGRAGVAVVEALLGWQHPTRGRVPALDLLDAAEAGALLDAIGDGLLQQACTQFMAWKQAFGDAAPRRLAINLSAAELGRAGLAVGIEAVLAEAGMAASALQIELGDAVLADAAAPLLQHLRGAGLQLVLDDFGSGNASLARLQQVPVDAVKIDRRFVHQSPQRESQQVLVEAVVSMARLRGLQVVAKGIETAAEAALMAVLGCDAGQGPAWCRPLPADALTAWMQAGAWSAPDPHPGFESDPESTPETESADTV